METQLPSNSTPSALPELALGAIAPVYETELARDWNWGMNEAGKHFEGRSKVFEAMRKIAQRLDELEISYAVVGDMAVFKYGLLRFTEDVHLLVTPESLKKIHEQLDGLGYLRLHSTGKHLRDTQLGVKIELLTTGGFPGDGKPKPIAFPNPQAVSLLEDGVSFIQLPSLLELKLASGMTNSGRYKDLGDVQELIKALSLKPDFAEQLHPYVRTKFIELCAASQQRFVKPWILKPASGKLQTIDDLIKAFPANESELQAMQQAGVQLEPAATASDPLLVTTDPEVATQFDMIAEFDYWNEEEAASE